MLMIRPQPFSSSIGTAKWQVYMSAVRSVSMTSRHSWAVILLKLWSRTMAALLTRISSRPRSSLDAAEHALDLVVVSDITVLGESLAAGRFDFLKDVRGEIGGVMVVNDRRGAGVR